SNTVAGFSPRFHNADSLKRHLRLPILMRVPTTTLRPRARYPSTSWKLRSKTFSSRINADTRRANSYVNATSETKYPGLLVNGTLYVEKSLSARRPTARVDHRAVHFRPIQVTVRSPECLGRRSSGSPGRNGNDN